MMDLVGIADQDQIGEAFAQNDVRGLEVSFLLGFGQDDGFDVVFGFRLDSLYKFHKSLSFRF